MNAWQRALAWLRGTPRPRPLRYALGLPPEPDFRPVGRLEDLRVSLARRAPSPEKWLYRLGWRSAAGLTLPDVLGIGAQKSATSWLHANLAVHPQVFVPPQVKEVHYFDLLFREPLAEYAALFAAGRDRVKCDVTPGYAKLSRSRIRFVSRVMPRVRLLLLLRDPVERAWSQAVMDLASRSGRRVEEVGDDEYLAHFRDPRVVANGLYTRIAERWLEHFPPEHLLVVFQEDARDRPRELLARVFAHIGVTPDVDWGRFPLAERVFAGPGAPLPERFRPVLAGLFADESRRAARRFGGAARSWSAL